MSYQKQHIIIVPVPFTCMVKRLLHKKFSKNNQKKNLKSDTRILQKAIFPLPPDLDSITPFTPGALVHQKVNYLRFILSAYAFNYTLHELKYLTTVLSIICSVKDKRPEKSLL